MLMRRAGAPAPTLVERRRSRAAKSLARQEPAFCPPAFGRVRLKFESTARCNVTTKDLLRETAERLPDGASVEDAIERLLFLAKIERGKADTEAGRTVSHEEVKRRLGL